MARTLIDRPVVSACAILVVLLVYAADCRRAAAAQPPRARAPSDETPSDEGQSPDDPVGHVPPYAGGRLEAAIRQGLPVVSGLSSTDQSRKGGSVRYGMWHAAQTVRPNHVVLFTDADLSTHLGQSGLLMAPILERGAASAVGSRREPTSVVVTAGQRNTRG